ncbi:MAG: hypothetical protein A2293_05475 [Elusimicrobia bacterium RIFOXYB2_FULL_49_7]|nr:MAG: hypothetical protein A2293_05475 [Elusimicrobia bacterium RIFOXYB2_FULL_49_7]
MPKTPHSAPRLFKQLVAIMSRLRSPDGCPWDKHQTHASLLPHLFSEAKEVKQAVRKRDWENLEEELGDILLQVVFHSQVAQERGAFTIADVVRTLNKKLIRRHPHVFGRKKPSLSTPGQVVSQWQLIKDQEKRRKKLKKQKQKSEK